ncbi:MAG: hypothetical protein HOV81_19885 [Kofleriaceae bacterium]|nr:hypothetical protein [Kofleriaceae bacterium]
MPSRPDLRELATNVKEAFGDMDRETLLEILTFVVKEYVVEGPPPMLVHQAETLADLKNATFAQVISALQTRFDFPELQMFVVDGEQVSVRVGGVMQPLLAARQPLTGQAPAAELPRPAAGVRVVETTLQQRPPQPAPTGFIDTRQSAAAPQPSSAPPPSRGLSVRGRPSGEGEGNVANAPQAQGAQPAPQQPAPAQPQPGAPQQSDKPDTAGGDDASARFSLLELD